MFWDFAITYVVCTLSVAGWNIGLLNSWCVPIAFIAATAVTRLIYIDASVYMIEQLRMPADPAVFISYFGIWVVAEVAATVVLLFLFPRKPVRQLRAANKICGALLGFAKGAAIIVFATLATACATNLPVPASYTLAGCWLAHASRHSLAVTFSELLAGQLPVAVDRFVVSTKPPRYQPHFLSTDLTRPSPQLRQLIESLREIRALEAAQL